MKLLVICIEEDQNIIMRQIELTPDQKSCLELRHKQCKDVKECYRLNAVLLRSEGWTISMIAEALRIHVSTVVRHLDDYKKDKLTIRSGGSSSILNEEQTTELIAHLESQTYHTTQAIVAYVQEQYEVSYSVPGLNKWLHRNGFSYKKPKGYPYKASKEQQEQFISEYTKLKENLGQEDDILFMDACHPSMSTKVAYGWIKKGQSKPIETTASRTRMNLVGAISLNNLAKPIVASYTTVDGDSIIDFLQQIRKYSDVSGTIHLILDQAGYQSGTMVAEEANKLNIHLHYLPAYSPNLNPIERLWKVMNEHARNNKFFKTAHEFRNNIMAFFARTVPKIASSLSARINDNFQKLDYAF